MTGRNGSKAAFGGEQLTAKSGRLEQRNKFVLFSQEIADAWDDFYHVELAADDIDTA